MIIERDIYKLLGQLSKEQNSHITIDGSDIKIHFAQEVSKLSLSTIVYNGGNYIPSSVRRCLSHKLPFHHSDIKTFLTIDENHYTVELNYLGLANSRLNYHDFKELLEEFGGIAEKWRDYLDENDKNDLVYVRTK